MGKGSHSRLAVLADLLRLLLWVSGDGNVNVSALFEPHIIAVLVSQRIFDTEISVTVVSPANSNLRLFRLTRTWRRNDFVDGSGHGGTWLL